MFRDSKQWGTEPRTGYLLTLNNDQHKELTQTNRSLQSPKSVISLPWSYTTIQTTHILMPSKIRILKPNESSQKEHYFWKPVFKNQNFTPLSSRTQRNLTESKTEKEKLSNP